MGTRAELSCPASINYLGQFSNFSERCFVAQKDDFDDEVLINEKFERPDQNYHVEISKK